MCCPGRNIQEYILKGQKYKFFSFICTLKFKKSKKEANSPLKTTFSVDSINFRRSSSSDIDYMGQNVKEKSLASRKCSLIQF